MRSCGGPSLSLVAVASASAAAAWLAARRVPDRDTTPTKVVRNCIGATLVASGVVGVVGFPLFAVFAYS